MSLLQGIADYARLHRHFYSYDSVEIQRYQKKELQRLLDYAMERSPFYRDLYHGYTGEFQSLPVINKEIMMHNFTGLNTCGLDREEVMAFALQKERDRDYTGYFLDEYVVGLSSGTSGNKGIYITPKEMTRRLPFVILARSGIPLKNLPFRILFLLRVFSQGFADIRAPFLSLKYMSTMTDVDAVIDAINTERINVLMAPPSMLRILLPRRDRILVPIDTIVSYAEVLTAEDKARFRTGFGAKVIEIYQASEGQMGSACKCGNLHINEDLVYVELYDGQGNPVTEPSSPAARMIVTNLVNRAQPLIRYEMNDLVVLGEPCPCGSAFRVIDRVIGRHDDVLYFANRQGVMQHVFPDLFSRFIITESDLIREFKVIQRGHALQILIDGPSAPEAQKEIRDALFKRIPAELSRFDIEDVSLSIEFRKLALPADKSKYKRFETEQQVSSTAPRSAAP
jgi:putative adenylate-forming enzyme